MTEVLSLISGIEFPFLYITSFFLGEFSDFRFDWAGKKYQTFAASWAMGVDTYNYTFKSVVFESVKKS